MHHIYQTEGIVIGGMASGEKSRKIYLFGREVGIVLGKVQAARALSSKLRSSVQDFSYGNFSLVRGKNEWKVVGAKAEGNFFESLKENKEKIRAAARVLNLIKRLVEEGTETHAIYDDVKEFLLHLPRYKKTDLKSAECLILLRILNKLGFLRSDPDLVVCLEDSIVSEKALNTVKIHERKAISLINESLYAAEVNNPTR